MCLIIDANVLTLVIGLRPDPEFLPIRQALEKKTAIAFFGGQLRREYLRLTRFLAIIAELRRSGALHRLDDQEVDRQMELFKKRRLVSDDPHILAVAEVSKVRLLCSHDKELHADFTNPNLLGQRAPCTRISRTGT